MKNTTTRLRLLILVMAFVYSGLQINAQITSAPLGGNWTDPTTWIGLSVPGPADSVIIASSVAVNSGGASCNGLYISPAGSLFNVGTNNQTLTVNGSITNEGSIGDNYYNFTIFVKGNITQNGIWNNHRIYLDNPASHSVVASQPFANDYINNNQPGNTLYFNSDISLNGVVSNFNNSTIMVAENDSLIVNGGSMAYGNFSLPHFNLKLTSGAYMNNCTFQDVTLWGTIDVMNNVAFNGLTTNNGILENRGTNTYVTAVAGHLINNGTIQNNYYNLLINTSGNITNNGTWSNYTTTLNGITNQEMVFTQPFSGTNLVRTNGDGKIIAQTDLSFINTNIDLNYDTLEFISGMKLSNSAGYIWEAVIVKSNLPALKIEGSNAAYYRNITIDGVDIELLGTINIGTGTNTIKGEATLVSGILQNRETNNQTLYVEGGLINNGSINNNYYNLTLYISGDIENHGTWTNYITNLNGSENQSLICTNFFSGGYFVNTNTDGIVIANSWIGFENTAINFNNDTLLFDNGYELDISGGYLDQVRIIKTNTLSNPFEFEMLNSSYFKRSEFMADSIKLSGVVQFQTTPVSFSGHVVNNGTFRNHGSNNYTATIFGSLTNKGSITNNYYNSTFNVSGDLHNSGTWNNQTVNLNGDDNQQFYFTSAVNFSYLYDINSNGHLIAQTDLEFNDCAIDLNNDTLIFDAGSKLTLNDCVLNEAVIINQSSKSSAPLDLTMTDGSYLTRSKFVSNELNLYGTIQVGTAPIEFYGNVSNYGILQNINSSNYVANFFGDLINMGTIQNNYYVLNLYIHGGITQSGTWINNYTYLEGLTDHDFNFTEEFNGSYLTNNNASANIAAGTNLIFNGTDIDLNGSEISLPDMGLLSVQNGYIVDGSLEGNNLQFHTENAYCTDLIFPDITLFGAVQVGANVSFNGNVINEGTLMNRSGNHYTISVLGDIQNNGTISNNYYNLYVQAHANISNNGSWDNNYTMLDGTVDQYVYIQNGNSIDSQLRIDANYAGSYAWYGGSFIGPLINHPDYFTYGNSQVIYFDDPIDATYFGTFYCTDGGETYSRNIHIMDEPLPLYQLDLTIMLEGPFNGTDMNTDLNANGSLPLVHPYLDYPWNYPGPESVAVIPNIAVVDWINIELRDAVDAASANNSTTIKKYSAFVLNNGQIVGLDGSSLLSFYGPITNDLYVVIRHRNHLDIMSAFALTETGCIYSYDFTYDSWNSYGGPLATKNLIDNITPLYGMMGGDSNKDDTISTDDQYYWMNNAGTPIGYEQPDNNFDGQINNQDKNDSWAENLGATTQYPE